MSRKEQLVMWTFIVILVVAVALRLYDLPIRAMHHDEVSGHHTFANDLYEHKKYRYDPVYHGPLLYHFMALSYYMFEINDISNRLPSALFGIAILFLVWQLRRWMGDGGMLLVAALIAVSPVNVYFSRFAIHDPPFAFFTLASVVSLFYFVDNPNWKRMILLGGSLGFLFTVKENAYFIAGIIGGYAAIEMVFFQSTAKTLAGKIKSALQKVYKNEKILGIGVLAFLVPFSIFFTSFFRFPTNIIDAVTLPIKKWVELSTTWSGHFKPAEFYIHLLTTFELAILGLGLVGLVVCIWKFKTAPYYRFIAVWTILNASAYFILKYKMSWLVMHLALPLAVAAGFGLQALWNEKWKYLIVAVCGFLLIYSFAAAVQQSFYEYDEPSNKEFAYVQTNRDIFRMIDDVERHSGKDYVKVIGEDYVWAIFWYLNRRGIANGHYREIPTDITERSVLSLHENLNITSYRKEKYNLGHHGIWWGYYKQ